MPQHLLHGPEVGAAFQQMGRERMAHGMGADRLFNAGTADVSAQYFPYSHPRNGAAAKVQKDSIAGRRPAQFVPGLAQVTIDPVDGFRSDGHDPLPAALADHAHDLQVEQQMHPFQPGQFRHPETRSVQHLEQRAVPQTQRRLRVRLHHQAFHLVDVQDRGQFPAQFRRLHMFGGIVFDDALRLQKPMKHPDRGQIARHAGRFQAEVSQQL